MIRAEVRHNPGQHFQGDHDVIVIEPWWTYTLYDDADAGFGAPIARGARDTWREAFNEACFQLYLIDKDARERTVGRLA